MYRLVILTLYMRCTFRNCFCALILTMKCVLLLIFKKRFCPKLKVESSIGAFLQTVVQIVLEYRQVPIQKIWISLCRCYQERSANMIFIHIKYFGECAEMEHAWREARCTWESTNTITLFITVDFILFLVIWKQQPSFVSNYIGIWIEVPMRS